MIEVNIHEAKTHLSRLLRKVQAGEEILIKKAGKPVARLIAARGKRGARPLGLDKDRFVVPPDFNAPLPDDILDAFEGRR